MPIYVHLFHLIWEEFLELLVCIILEILNFYMTTPKKYFNFERFDFERYCSGTLKLPLGLDPAQPCFRTSNIAERLDKSDADFVDVIHTNGRLLKKIGFGLPEPTGPYQL